MRKSLPILVALALVSRGTESGEAESALRYPELTVATAGGSRIPVFSIAAYRAEFRYLRSECWKIDLTGPALESDGWTKNIRETEWPLMAFSYFGYACANLAKYDPSTRNETLPELRWLIEALQTPRMSGFIAPHLGAPFGSDQIHPSVFVHGHFLNLALRYRAVSADTRYDDLIHRVATALAQEFLWSGQGILRSYRDMWWLSDNCPALSALAQYDLAFQTNRSAVSARFVQSVKAYYLDPSNGLLATYVDPAQHRRLQEARGVSLMYALIYLRDFDPAFAKDQYDRARSCFVRDALGLAAVREFPKTAQEQPDVDSGALVLGFGPSASGFAIAAAAVMDDAQTAWHLLKSATLVGGPVMEGEELRFTQMPMVGQAVILFGKTQLLGRSRGPTK